MIRHLIVPVDGSDVSWRGVDVALGLARRCDAVVRIVQVEHDPVSVTQVQQHLNEGLSRRDAIDVEVHLDVRLTHTSVAAEIEEVTRLDPNSIVVMSSSGRGRSAAVVGSVAQDVLRRIEGSVMLVGPRASIDLGSGPVVIAVDGSTESEAALPVGASWATSLRRSIRITKVISPPSGWAPDYVAENGYLAEVAAHMVQLSGQAVDVEVLQDSRPGRAVADDAAGRSASVIVASSHGRGGLTLILLGSVTSEFVRRASCPVIVVRAAQG